MAIRNIDRVPLRSKPSSFSEDMEWLLSNLAGWTVEVNETATEVAELAEQTNSDAVSLAANTPVVLASANFKGLWSSLLGALNVPASVYHVGGYWMLASNLADVTAKEPSVDPEWVMLNLGREYINASKSIFMGDFLVDTSAGAVTLTLPDSPNLGYTCTFIDVAGTWETNNLTLARNGETIMGLAENMTANVSNIQFTIWYNGSDWRLI